MAAVRRSKCALVHLKTTLPLLKLAQLFLQAALLRSEYLNLLLHLVNQCSLVLRQLQSITPGLFGGGLLICQILALRLNLLKQALGCGLVLGQGLGLLAGLGSLLCPMGKLCLNLLQPLLCTLATFNHKTNFSL